MTALAIAAFFATSTPALAAVPLPGPDLLLPIVTAGAVALALVAALWAIAEQGLTRRLRRTLRAVGARTKNLVGERDALLSSGREALIVWGRDGSGPRSYGGAEAIIDSCLAGADALELSRALDGLSERAESFSLTARDRNGHAIHLRGRAVGAAAAVWIEPERASKSSSPDFRAVLDAVPVPVWLRDRALSLVWANRAYAEAGGAADAEAAVKAQIFLEKSEADLAATARNTGAMQESRRFAVVNGQRRALSFTHQPIAGGTIVGSAVDVTDLVQADAKLQQHLDAHADTLDRLATAVAIFAADQKLSFYNRAFAELWSLPESWLDGHPSDGEILDRLREGRKLPEQRDYQAWKRERLSLYGAAHDYLPEEEWHLPGGKTLRVVAQPHPFGGLTFLYEDVTARIALESSYNTLIKVQSATLDTLNEGVAVFGPDGRLKLHNASFARIWDLEQKDLAGEPHVRTIAAASAEKFGDAEVWEGLIQAIVSGAQAKRELGEIERNDRTILSLALSALPDGATLVTFADVTDRFRIESALRDRNDALEAADRLKSDFIKHVSYELRTPLNTILGFAEHLASGIPGELNPRQDEYVHDIVAGANTLTRLVNDILDLSLIESGTLRLELTRIDLHALLGDVAAHARDWAAKAGLALEVDVPDDAGTFLGDDRRLRQVVFNLLSNAFKFTPRGGVITLSGRIQGEDVQIAVADNGPGIAPEVKANVFERFAAKSRAGQRAGAGLGLALVNRFVELHDGWVEIESGDPGEDGGTLVRCHLPRRIHDEGPATPEHGRTAA
ncbi:MAG: PAS-domain containing protein [Alphaproteobacteria bacterium]|nr:PAS-domain containing protein [Alphaproteobacteria bacterium]MBV9692927.1 PAS-domain containing protein [Alphaproteobacteria bacterium]